jgi:hypothetical protein
MNCRTEVAAPAVTAAYDNASLGTVANSHQGRAS